MKIVRAFMRVDKDITSDEAVKDWSLRMDSLLMASPIELNEFILDAILALAVRSGKPVDRVIEIIAEGSDIEGTDDVLNLIQTRWNNITASLEEHMSTAEARERLADKARTAEWEVT